MPDAPVSKVVQTADVLRLVTNVVAAAAAVVLLFATLAQLRAQRASFGSHDDCPNR